MILNEYYNALIKSQKKEIKVVNTELE